MSGRNSRIVRNRDRNKNEFSWNSKKTKMIGILVIIIMIVIITGVYFLKGRNKASVAQISQTDINTLYEYFVLSTDNYLGVIDKQGNKIIDTKYVRNRYSKSRKRCICMLYRR